MASPIVAEDFNNQDMSGPLCDQFREKLLNNSKIATLLEYLFDADGNFSADLVADLAKLMIPVGTMRMSAKADAGVASDNCAVWLPCDGTAYEREDYPTLAALLGETYNTAADDSTFRSTYFRTPNASGRFLLASGQSDEEGATNHAIASNGGEENHILTEAELPEHDHNVGSVYARAATAASLRITEEQATDFGLTTSLAGMDHESSGHTTSSDNAKWAEIGESVNTPVGDGDGHNTMPPFVTCACYILAGYKSGGVVV